MASPEISFLFIALSLVSSAIVFNGLHIVEEGHVGIYFRGGALLSTISEPGYHLKLPLITHFENVQVTV